MKERKLLWGILVGAVLLAFMSCTRSDENVPEGIEGTYYGTLTRTVSLNPSETDGSGIEIGEGMAEIADFGDHRIGVHCIGENIDTLFMLNYYQNHDSVMVCLTGEDFESMYGHMPGEGHMTGGMMADLSEDETEWMHHLNDEHESDDTHFGGFDLHRGTFTYSIRMQNETELYYIRFTGSKNQ